MPDNSRSSREGFVVAVIGATGNVGREMLNILSERQFPADEVHAIASRRSMGVEVSFGDRVLKCQDLEQFDFKFDRVFAPQLDAGNLNAKYDVLVFVTGAIPAPARPVRTVSARDLVYIGSWVKKYVRLAQAYRRV